MTRLRSIALLGSVVLAPFALSGCHSAFVQATVVNRSGQVVHSFEVDYPSASFGGNELGPEAEFHYRFKVLGSGHTKVLWTDAQQHDHTVQGPELHEGAEGTMMITLGADSATWDTRVHTR